MHPIRLVAAAIIFAVICMVGYLIVGCAPAPRHFATVELPSVAVHLIESDTPDGEASIWGREISVTGRVVNGEFYPDLYVLGHEIWHVMRTWSKAVADSGCKSREAKLYRR